VAVRVLVICVSVEIISELLVSCTCCLVPAAMSLLLTDASMSFQIEICNMVIECCSQERTYMRFYGLLGERFCRLQKMYQEQFDECFAMHVSILGPTGALPSPVSALYLLRCVPLLISIVFLCAVRDHPPLRDEPPAQHRQVLRAPPLLGRL
jgi:hypothetical protein